MLSRAKRLTFLAVGRNLAFWATNFLGAGKWFPRCAERATKCQFERLIHGWRIRASPVLRSTHGWRRLLSLGVCDPEGTFFSGPASSRVYSREPCRSNTVFAVPV